jgi:hypothetical protein
LLLLAALILGAGIPLGGAGQQPAKGALQNAKRTPQIVPKKETTPPRQHARAPAEPRRAPETMRTTPKPPTGALQNAERKQVTAAKEQNLLPRQGVKAPAEAKRAAEARPATQTFAGMRDPFKLPSVGGTKSVEGVPESAAGLLPPGTRGLIISQLRLQGVVREETSNKMIAVVTNETGRAYFLRDNDTVYNGAVSKITPDSVYFKENILDQDGRVSIREVVKRLGSAPGEGR